MEELSIRTKSSHIERGVSVMETLVHWPLDVFDFLKRWPVIPIVVLVTFVVLSAFAPWVAPHDPIGIDLAAHTAPGFWNPHWYAQHPDVTTRYFLGTDHVGRDILSRMIYGGRVTLLVCLVALASGTVIGSALALVAGYYGGLLDEVILRMVDVWYAVPFLLIAILAAIAIGQSLTIITVLLALAAWSSGVRNVRAEVLSLRERDYVLMARVAGASSFRIMLRHLLPGVVNTIVVIATLRIGGLILLEAGLSFLGAGIPPPTPTWGNMIAGGREYLNTAWWIDVFPGIALFLVVMSFNFLGDWLRDRWDPRLRQTN